MHLFKKYLLLALSLASLQLHAQILPSFGNSRTGASGMQFLKIAPDARSLAMGGAAVAVNNDVSAMFWNPAALTGVDTAKVHAQYSNTRYFGNISSNFAGVLFKTGKLSYTGIQVMALDYGDMKETTEFEQKGTGRTFSPVNMMIGASYAKILTSNFSFGLNGKLAQEGYAGVNVFNVLFDIGLKYNIGVKNARFGVSFSNFGLNVNPTGKISILKFEGSQDIKDFSAVSAPSVFRLGVAFDPIQAQNHTLTLAGQLNHPTDNNETFCVGAEYMMYRILYLRTGYEFGSDRYYVAPSAGIGLKLINYLGGITIDYGFLAKNQLGNVHRIGIALHFIKK